MRGPLTALIWELWRTSRIELLIRLGSLCGLMIAICAVSEEMNAAQILAVRGISTALAMFCSLLAQTWLGQLDSRSRGYSFRLGFVRPIRTSMLVLIPLLFCSVTSIIIFLVPMLLLGQLLQVPVPLLNPAFAVGLVTAAAVCLTWSFPNRAEGIGGLMVLCAICGWMIQLLVTPQSEPEPLLIRIGAPEFFVWQWPHVVAGLLVIGGLIPLCIRSVDRQRHGDATSVFGLFVSAPFAWRRWWSLPAGKSRMKCGRPFSGRLAAQFWYEWNHYGFKTVLLGAVSAFLWGSFLTVCDLLSPRLQFDPRIWTGSLLLGPVIFQFVAADGAVGLTQIHGTTRLSLFDATRSLTNDQFIAIKLLMIACCSAAGWLCLLAAATGNTLICGSWASWAGHLGELSDVMIRLPWYWKLTTILNLLLAFFSTSSLLLAFGMWVPRHTVFFTWLVMLGILQQVAIGWDAKRGWVLQPFWLTEFWLIAFIIAWLSLKALWTAFRSRSLNPWFLGTVFALWVIYLGTAMAVWQQLPSSLSDMVPWKLLLPASVLLLTPLSSAAFAPLALADARHQ